MLVVYLISARRSTIYKFAYCNVREVIAVHRFKPTESETKDTLFFVYHGFDQSYFIH